MAHIAVLNSHHSIAHHMLSCVVDFIESPLCQCSSTWVGAVQTGCECWHGTFYVDTDIVSVEPHNDGAFCMAGCTVLAMEVAAIIGTPKQNYTHLFHMAQRRSRRATNNTYGQVRRRLVGQMAEMHGRGPSPRYF